MKDKWGRTIDYLRLSLTDRCNLRCRYCMPEALASVGHDAVLRYEEMLLICRAALALGIDRFKITGGEPLVRKGAVAFMKALKEMDGVRSVTLTTNGLLLSEALPDLVRMGIDGINISLDSLDERRAIRRPAGLGTGCSTMCKRQSKRRLAGRNAGSDLAAGGTGPDLSRRRAFHRTHAHRLRDDPGRPIGSGNLVPSGPGLS